MFGRPKPDRKKALKELQQNAVLFSTVLVCVRAAPYILSLYSSK